jgi:hypothetical protein
MLYIESLDDIAFDPILPDELLRGFQMSWLPIIPKADTVNSHYRHRRIRPPKPPPPNPLSDSERRTYEKLKLVAGRSVRSMPIGQLGKLIDLQQRDRLWPQERADA